ncbi:MAG: GNAT family N-acetyltransferase [Proteobacteria bacterium]|nr:GNAT family N-acetyltransferase [Pseudomonadota bacterium]
MTIRLLEPSDEVALDEFLRSRSDTSMFLRGNLQDGGLNYAGETYQGRYLGCFDRQGIMSGVLGHFWNGRVRVAAPEPVLIRKLAAALLAGPDMEISGFSGAGVQVDDLIHHLGLNDSDFRLRVKEQLFSLRLDQLLIPDIGTTSGLVARLATVTDLDLLAAWRRHYDEETSLGTSGDIKKIQVMMAQTVKRERCWILECNGEPVAMSGFNAVLPDSVQVGGVYTVPRFRNRGFARYLVAETLRAVRRKGVESATLFTKNPAAAIAYRSIGFGWIGDYGLALLHKPAALAKIDPGAGAFAPC